MAIEWGPEDTNMMRTIGTWFVGVALTIMAMSTIGPELESRFYPVYDKFVILTITPIKPGWVRVQFRSTKYRICAPRGFVWFEGQADETSRIVDYDIVGERDGLLPEGDFVSLPYDMNVTEEELRTTVYAEVFSKCHFLWLTKSVVYP